MKILVIGANGRTGKLVVEQAIQRGHTVTAFTRKPDQLKDIPGLAKIIKGDALNLADLVQAVTGQDVVISAVGISGIARNLVSVMSQAGVSRLVMTSSRSVVATRPKWAVRLAWLFFFKAYLDLTRAEGVLEGSSLDYSIVRATMLNNKPFTGKVHTDFEANATGVDRALTRADYAMTLLDVAEDAGMIRKAVGVCGEKPVKNARLRTA